jgi:hypothetical protein
MGGEMPLFHEGGQHRLHDRRGIGVDRRPRLGEVVHQVRRHDQIAKADGGEQHLREGSDVKNTAAAGSAAVRVQPLKRRERPAGVTVLAVVVVLDQPGTPPARPGQQLEPAGQAHGGAPGILVRRRDHGQTCVVGQRPAGRHRKTLFVEGDRHQAGTRGAQGAAQTRIAGLFDPDGIAGLQQHPGYKVEGRLGAGGDEHLFGRTGDTAQAAQIGGNGRPQRQVTGRRRRHQEVEVRTPPYAAQQPAPDVEGKQAQIRHARREGP